MNSAVKLQSLLFPMQDLAFAAWQDFLAKLQGPGICFKINRVSTPMTLAEAFKINQTPRKQKKLVIENCFQLIDNSPYALFIDNYFHNIRSHRQRPIFFNSREYEIEIQGKQIITKERGQSWEDFLKTISITQDTVILIRTHNPETLKYYQRLTNISHLQSEASGFNETQLGFISELYHVKMEYLKTLDPIFIKFLNSQVSIYELTADVVELEHIKNYWLDLPLDQIKQMAAQANETIRHHHQQILDHIPIRAKRL